MRRKEIFLVLFLLFLQSDTVFSSVESANKCSRPSVNNSIQSIIQAAVKPFPEDKKEFHKELVKTHCASPIVSSLSQIGKKFLAQLEHIPGIRIAKSILENSPFATYHILKLPALLLNSKSDIHAQQLAEQNLLQFVFSDSSIATLLCPVLNVGFIFFTLVFSYQFFLQNKWFFEGLLPHEVPELADTNEIIGFWAIFSSGLFSILGIVCSTASNRLSDCEYIHQLAAAGVYPALLICLYGMISSAIAAAKAEKLARADEDKQETTKPNIKKDDYISYAWRLNNYPAQVEQTDQQPQTTKSTTKKIDKTKNLPKTPKTEIKTPSHHKIFGSNSAENALAVFFGYHPGAYFGVVAVTLCLVAAIVPCSVPLIEKPKKIT
eukprot:c16075_g2_i1.p1 GENE.c16075_g2_i1~~c16075_g2_i1.p1  ORF type:complete len:388 (+),score=142.23 c16075_g2_i1:31-1164(+)